jgi:hypothetical protein
VTLAAGFAYLKSTRGTLLAVKVRNGGTKHLVDAGDWDEVGVRGDVLYFVGSRRGDTEKTAYLMQTSAVRPSTVRTLAALPGPGAPAAIAFDEALFVCTKGELYEVPYDGSPAAKRAEGVPCGALAFDAGYVYAASASDRMLIRLPKAGGVVEVIAQGRAFGELAVIGERVFYLDREQHVLGSVPKAGGASIDEAPVGDDASQLVAARAASSPIAESSRTHDENPSHAIEFSIAQHGQTLEARRPRSGMTHAALRQHEDQTAQRP